MSATILLVMPPQRRDKLACFLSQSGLNVISAADVAEASRLLAVPLFFDLVFADAELPDGSWQEVLALVMSSQRPCEMVVCSRCGDEQLWAEVLQRGVYDLVAEPYEHSETLRIIRSALDSQHLQRFSHPAKALAS